MGLKMGLHHFKEKGRIFIMVFSEILSGEGYL